MAKSPDRLNVRVGLEGDEEVRRGLENLGEAGQRAFQSLVRASEDAQKSTQGMAQQFTVLRQRMGEVQESVGRIGERFRFVGGEIARVGATIAAAFSVRAIIHMTSAWADLTGRIRNAIPATADAADVMQRLVDVAQRSYQEIDVVANAFATSARSLREMGLSMEKQLDLFEAINNAMTLSGAKGVQAESVMRALTRAMQEGALKGANFQAVLDNGGRILEVLADHLNTTVAGLTKMAKEGRITGKVLQEALLGALPKLRADLDEMDDTIADGFLKIRNAMQAWVGQTDEATGFSRTLASALVWVAENFDLVAKVVATVIAGFLLLKTIGLAVEMFTLAKALIGLIGPLAKISALMIASPWGLMAAGLLAAAVAVLALTGNLDSFASIITDTVASLTGFSEEAEAAGEKAKGALEGADKATSGLSTGAQAASQAMKGVSDQADTLATEADKAKDSTVELGDKGVEAGANITTEMEKTASSIVTLGENVDSTTESFLRMAEAAKEAARAAQAATGGDGGSGGGGIGFAGGGRVRGPGTGTSDSILARLSNGEYVVRAAAVRKYGTQFLDAINRMRLGGNKAPAFRDGGPINFRDFVGGLAKPVAAARFASGGLARAASVNIVERTAPAGRPLSLTIGDQTFTGLTAPEDVATQLSQFATARQVRRAGRAPSWYRG